MLTIVFITRFVVLYLKKKQSRLHQSMLTPGNLAFKH